MNNASRGNSSCSSMGNAHWDDHIILPDYVQSISGNARVRCAESNWRRQRPCGLRGSTHPTAEGSPINGHKPSAGNVFLVAGIAHGLRRLHNFPCDSAPGARCESPRVGPPASQWKFGWRSAPVRQVNRVSMSDGWTSSGHRSPLIATQCAQVDIRREVPAGV